MKGLETKTDHECSRYGYRSAKPSRTLNEGPKTKGHQQNLQATIGCDSGNRFFHDFKLASFDRDVVEVNRCKNDPSYFQHPESNPIPEAHRSQYQWHFEDKNRDGHRCQSASDRAPMRFHFEAAQQSEKHDNGKSRNECREPPTAKWIVNLNPLHTFSLRRGPKHVARNKIVNSGKASATAEKSALLSKSRVMVPPNKKSQNGE